MLDKTRLWTKVFAGPRPGLDSLEPMRFAMGSYGQYFITTFLTHAGRKRARLSTYTVGGTFTGNRSFSSSAAARRYVDQIEEG